MRYDPLQRPSLSQALQSPFFQVTSDLALSSSSDALRDDRAASGMNTNGFEHPSHLAAGLLYDPADPATHSPPLNENRPPENVPPSSYSTSSYNTTQYPTSTSSSTTAAGAAAYNTYGSSVPTDRLNNSSSITQLVAHIDSEPSTENTDFLGEIAGMLRESQHYQKPSVPVPASSSSSTHLHSTTTGYNYNTGNNNTSNNNTSTNNGTSAGTHADDDGFGDASEDQFGFGAPAASTFSTSNRYILRICCILVNLPLMFLYLSLYFTNVLGLHCGDRIGVIKPHPAMVTRRCRLYMTSLAPLKPLHLGQGLCLIRLSHLYRVDVGIATVARLSVTVASSRLVMSYRVIRMMQATVAICGLRSSSSRRD